MSASILLHSPSPCPSPASLPLPALQTDVSSSSSSSTSGSCLDLHPTSSPPSTRRIRFAPLPDPRRDLLDPLDPSPDDLQLDPKSATHTPPAPNNLPDDFVALSPSVSPDSTLSSARSTPTIRVSPNTPSNTQKSNMKLFRPFSFLRASRPSSASPSPSPSQSSLPPPPPPCSVSRSTTSLPNSPSFQSAKLPRFLTEDILTLGTKSLFRPRSGSASTPRAPRTSSPPPRSSSLSRSLHRSASPGSGPDITLTDQKHDRTGASSQFHDTPPIAGLGPRKRRVSSSALTPGTGGGRHASSVKLPSDSLRRPSTAPSAPTAAPRRHVKMLNGRVYGAKRYAAQTLANPFANVREEPEFVEWGYGGMGSVHASAGIANDMWKGLQRSERGGALLAGSFGSPSESPHPTAGGGKGVGTRPTSPITRRKMSESHPECSMGNVGAGGTDEDDGSGMGWVKRRRAEREAKARLEQETKELKKPQEVGEIPDSTDASIYASTASTTTSLATCTSAASTDLTTPATSPLVSRPPSLVDLNLTSSPTESRHLPAAAHTVTGKQSQKSDPSAHPVSTSKEEHEHHVLTAVRLSPNISTSSHKHGHLAPHGRTLSLSHAPSGVGNHTDNGGSGQSARLSPVDTEETTTSANSSELSRCSDEGGEQDNMDDDEEDEAQDIRRRTAFGAGVEKISRHVGVEVR